MNKSWISILIWLGLLSAPLGLRGEIALDLNFIENPGFETGKDETPLDWHHSKADYLPKTKEGKNILFLEEEDAAYGWEDGGFKGAKHISLEVKKSGKFGCWATRVKNIKPNTDYTITFWYQQPKASSFSLVIFGKIESISIYRITPQWLNYSKTFNSGGFSGECNLGFLVEGGKNQKVLIDDVGLYEDTIIPAYASYSARLGYNDARLQYHYYKEGYISPDMASPLYMGIIYRFKDKQPANLKAILELPEKVEVASYLTRIHDAKTAASLEKEKITKDGLAYTRYTISYPVTRTEYTHWSLTPADVIWYLTTTLKEGEVNAYYYIKWEGKNEEAITKLPLKVIRIKKTIPPKELIVFALFINLDMMETWPDAISNLKSLGINAIDLPITWRKDFFDLIRSKGFIISGGWAILSGYQDYPEDFATAIDGNKVTYYHDRPNIKIDPAGYPWHRDRVVLPCLLKRGKGFQQSVERYKKHVDAGATLLLTDDEGELPCFCNECIEKFKTFLKELSAVLKSKAGESYGIIDPRRFESNPENHPELHQAWVEFGKWKWAMAFKDLKKEVQKHAAEKGLSSVKLYNLGESIGHYSPSAEGYIIPFSTYLAKAFGEVFDYYGEQMYIGYSGYIGSPERVGKYGITVSRNIAGSGLKHFPVLQGEMSCYFTSPIYPPKVMKYQLLETFASGVSGVCFYEFRDSGMNLMMMNYIGEAVNSILPVEEIIMKGAPIASSELEGGRGVRLDDEAVIVVSDYSTFSDTPKEVNVSYKAKEIMNIIDLETKEALPKISPAKPSFKVTLGKERARLFYIGKKEKL